MTDLNASIRTIGPDSKSLCENEMEKKNLIDYGRIRLALILFFAFFLVFLQAGAYSAEHRDQNERDRVERLGDAALVGLPATTIATTLFIGDRKGAVMWSQSLGVTAATTFGLKALISKERPDGSDNNSFPSAHASTTFHSAAYVHARYGFAPSVFPYLIAGYTAYSRVHAKKHFTNDVLAGALIGILSAHWLTEPSMNLNARSDHRIHREDHRPAGLLAGGLAALSLKRKESNGYRVFAQLGKNGFALSFTTHW